MEKVDLGTIVQEAIARFHQNRIGPKPRVFVMISGSLPKVPWHDRSLKEFTRLFLYECLLSNHPDATVEIAVRRKAELKDLNRFIGIQPNYWIQLRVSGRGLRILDGVVEELFSDLGYHCEEWIGVESSTARLGIFGTAQMPASKMVFCLESGRGAFKCDLLLPIYEVYAVPDMTSKISKHPTAERSTIV
ncbi:MAG TPA: hypothetical protein VIB79_28600 [Candidatus Binatia bacterium]|jgi:hypothetical protein